MPSDTHPGRTISGGDPLPNLKTMVWKVLQSNLHSIENVGDVPFHLVEPLLAQCAAPQLALIELASPHLKKESKYLWKPLALKDFFEVRTALAKGEMKESSNWRKVYLAAQEARQEKEASSRARLRDNYAKANSKREEKKLVYVPTLKADPKKNRHWSSSSTAPKPPSSLLAKARAKTISYAQTVNPKRAASSRAFPSSASSGPSSQPSSHPTALTYRPTIANTPLMSSSRPTHVDQPRFIIPDSKTNKAKPPPTFFPPLEARKEGKKGLSIDFFDGKGGAGATSPVVVTKGIRRVPSIPSQQQSSPAQSFSPPNQSVPARPPSAKSQSPPLPTLSSRDRNKPPLSFPYDPSTLQMSPPARRDVPLARKKEPTSLFIPQKKPKTI